MQKISARYVTEHCIIPDMARDKGTIYFQSNTNVHQIYMVTYSLHGEKCPYVKSDFTVDNRMYGNMPITVITPPEPKNHLECYRIYAVPDKDDMDKIRWLFVLEADQSSMTIEGSFLCRWDEKRRHHNYGPAFIIKNSFGGEIDEAVIRLIHGMYDGKYPDVGFEVFDPETGKSTFPLTQ